MSSTYHHIKVLSFPYKECATSYYSTLLCLMICLISTQGFSVENGIEKQMANNHGNIVYATNDEETVVINEGKITTVEGKSIRLLPGTHIKSGQELTVSVVSKNHKETLEQQENKERRENTASAIIKRQDNKPRCIKASYILRNHYPFQGSQTIIGKQLATIALLPIRTQVSPTNVFSILIKTSFNNTTIHNLFVLAFRPIYNPICSWGERGETIKVMLS